MPRFLIQRVLGDITDEQIDAAADHSTRVREDRFPEMEWEYSQVVRTGDGVTAYCVYAAPTEQQIRDHAAAAGLPADAVYEIERELVPM